jgi:hypothetical protein
MARKHRSVQVQRGLGAVDSRPTSSSDRHILTEYQAVALLRLMPTLTSPRSSRSPIPSTGDVLCSGTILIPDYHWVPEGAATA